MGSFNQNCFLSNSRINSGDKVVLMILSDNYSKSYKSYEDGLVYTTDLFKPISHYLVAEYYDYGLYNEIEEFSKHNQQSLDFLKTYMYNYADDNGALNITKEEFLGKLEKIKDFDDEIVEHIYTERLLKGYYFDHLLKELNKDYNDFSEKYNNLFQKNINVIQSSKKHQVLAIHYDIFQEIMNSYKQLTVKEFNFFMKETNNVFDYFMELSNVQKNTYVDWVTNSVDFMERLELDKKLESPQFCFFDFLFDCGRYSANYQKLIKLYKEISKKDFSDITLEPIILQLFLERHIATLEIPYRPNMYGNQDNNIMTSYLQAKINLETLGNKILDWYGDYGFDEDDTLYFLEDEDLTKEQKLEKLMKLKASFLLKE